MTAARRRRRRISIAVAVVALVAIVPAIAGARPAPHDSSESAEQVLTAIRSSSHRGYQGYARTTGTLGIPDVSQLGSLPALLGDETMLRVWWSSPAQWRVDELSDIGENDTYCAPGITWQWDSQTDTATRVAANTPLRLLQASDLTPDQLGRRLAQLASSPGATLRRIGARRIAGRTALGIEVGSQMASTVAAIDIWADASTGVPLETSITARGQTRPAISTQFLSFSSSAPKSSVDTFTPPPGAAVNIVDASNIEGLLGRLRSLPSVKTLASLPATDPFPGQRGVATYGEGTAQFAVISLSDGDGDALAKDLSSAGTVRNEGWARVITVSTPLLNVTLISTRFSDWLFLGTVPASTLLTAANSLRATEFADFRRTFNGPETGPGTGPATPPPLT